MVTANTYFVGSCVTMTLPYISVMPQRKHIQLSVHSHWVRTNRIWKKHAESKTLYVSKTFEILTAAVSTVRMTNCLQRVIAAALVNRECFVPSSGFYSNLSLRARMFKLSGECKDNTYSRLRHRMEKTGLWRPQNCINQGTVLYATNNTNKASFTSSVI
jgi:hypothetical protein